MSYILVFKSKEKNFKEATKEVFEKVVEHRCNVISIEYCGQRTDPYNEGRLWIDAPTNRLNKLLRSLKSQSIFEDVFYAAL